MLNASLPLDTRGIWKTADTMSYFAGYRKIFRCNFMPASTVIYQASSKRMPEKNIYLKVPPVALAITKKECRVGQR